MPASGEEIEHADRHRRELDARDDRVVALRPLEVEDEQEHQGEPREAVDEGGARGGREQLVAEEREVEHRRRLRAARSRTKSGSSTTAAARPTITSRVVPAGEPALRNAEHEPGEADHVRRWCRPGRGRAPCRRPESSCRTSTPRGAERCAERDVEPEDPGPVDRDERSAEHRPDDEPDRGHHRVRAHGEAELPAREGVGDERRGVREQEGAADSLQHAPEDQVGAAACEARAERGERRRRGSRARRRACGRRGRRAVPPSARARSRRSCRRGSPRRAGAARVEAALEVGQGDDQRARVDVASSIPRLVQESAHHL